MRTIFTITATIALILVGFIWWYESTIPVGDDYCNQMLGQPDVRDPDCINPGWGI